MAKKLILIAVTLMLTIAGNYVTVYASNTNPADNLDNRYETENIAGITMDQINEMSANSPNSLTPIQGLMLWMFAIIAFLKLAQKMDNLLQSLGLNVTQTGGRAIGDMLMVGMEIRNAGSAISKSMGMLGFGRGGGAPAPSGGTGSGGGTGTGSAGGRGPTPIPAGSPGSGPAPTGGSPGGTSPGGGPSTGGSGSATPGGGSPSGSSPTTPSSGATPSSGSPGSSSATSSPPSGGAASTSSTGSSAAATGSRNPIGRAVEWIRQDGIAQGAIKAGAKGGAIGLGVYGAKVGASKIGGAVSSRLGINGSSSDPTENVAANNNITPPISQSPADINNQGDTRAESASSGENLGEYQDSRPLDGTDDTPPIPTTINNEEYQDTSPTDSSAASDESSRVPTSLNNEEYNDVDSFNATTDTGPIPTSIDGVNTQSSDTDEDNTDESNSGSSSHVTESSGTWHESKPIDAAKNTVPIPTAKNNEGWNETAPSGGTPSSAVSADTVTPAAIPQTAVPAPYTASIPTAPSQVGQAESATPSSTAPQSTATSAVVSDTQPKQTESASAQAGAAIQQGNVASVSNADNSIRQDASATSVSSVISSENVSVVHESSSSHESATHDSSSGYGYASGSDADSGSGEAYESRQMPVNNQSISADLPQSAATSTAPPISVHDVTTVDSAIVSPVDVTTDPTASSTPAAQPDFNGVNASNPTTQPEAVPPTQTAAASKPPSASQPNTTIQAQTTNVTNVTDAGAAKPSHTPEQSSAQVIQTETLRHSIHGANAPSTPKNGTGNNRPTAKAKQKNSSVKARKRRR